MRRIPGKFKVAVEDLSGVWSMIQPVIFSCANLEGVEISSPSGHLIATDAVALDFLPVDPTMMTEPHGMITWNWRPFVHLVLISCESPDEYKTRVRPKLRGLITEGAIGNPVVAFVRPRHLEISAKGPKKAYDLVADDCNASGRRAAVAHCRLDPPTAYGVQFSRSSAPLAGHLLGIGILQDCLRGALGREVSARWKQAEVLVGELATMGDALLQPGHFWRAFAARDNLALMLQAAGRYSQALGHYRALGYLFGEFMETQDGHGAVFRRGRGGEETAALLDEERFLDAYDGISDAPSEFDTLQYLHARTASLLSLLGLRDAVAPRALRFLRTFVPRLGAADQGLFRRAWTFTAALETARTIPASHWTLLDPLRTSVRVRASDTRHPPTGPLPTAMAATATASAAFLLDALVSASLVPPPSAKASGPTADPWGVHLDLEGLPQALSGGVPAEEDALREAAAWESADEARTRALRALARARCYATARAALSEAACTLGVVPASVLDALPVAWRDPLAVSAAADGDPDALPAGLDALGWLDEGAKGVEEGETGSIMGKGRAPWQGPRHARSSSTPMAYLGREEEGAEGRRAWSRGGSPVKRRPRWSHSLSARSALGASREGAPGRVGSAEEGRGGEGGVGTDGEGLQGARKGGDSADGEGRGDQFEEAGRRVREALQGRRGEAEGRGERGDVNLGPDSDWRLLKALSSRAECLSLLAALTGAAGCYSALAGELRAARRAAYEAGLLLEAAGERSQALRVAVAAMGHVGEPGGAALWEGLGSEAVALALRCGWAQSGPLDPAAVPLALMQPGGIGTGSGPSHAVDLEGASLWPAAAACALPPTGPHVRLRPIASPPSPGAPVPAAYAPVLPAVPPRALPSGSRATCSLVLLCDVAPPGLTLESPVLVLSPVPLEGGDQRDPAPPPLILHCDSPALSLSRGRPTRASFSGVVAEAGLFAASRVVARVGGASVHVPVLQREELRVGSTAPGVVEPWRTVAAALGGLTRAEEHALLEPQAPSRQMDPGCLPGAPIRWADVSVAPRGPSAHVSVVTLGPAGAAAGLEEPCLLVIHLPGARGGTLGGVLGVELRGGTGRPAPKISLLAPPAPAFVLRHGSVAPTMATACLSSGSETSLEVPIDASTSAVGVMCTACSPSETQRACVRTGDGARQWRGEGVSRGEDGMGDVVVLQGEGECPWRHESPLAVPCKEPMRLGAVQASSIGPGLTSLCVSVICNLWTVAAVTGVRLDGADVVEDGLCEVLGDGEPLLVTPGDSLSLSWVLRAPSLPIRATVWLDYRLDLPSAPLGSDDSPPEQLMRVALRQHVCGDASGGETSGRDSFLLGAGGGRDQSGGSEENSGGSGPRAEGEPEDELTAAAWEVESASSLGASASASGTVVGRTASSPSSSASPRGAAALLDEITARIGAVGPRDREDVTAEGSVEGLSLNGKWSVEVFVAPPAWAQPAVSVRRTVLQRGPSLWVFLFTLQVVEASPNSDERVHIEYRVSADGKHWAHDDRRGTLAVRNVAGQVALVESAWKPAAGWDEGVSRQPPLPRLEVVSGARVMGARVDGMVEACRG